MATRNQRKRKARERELTLRKAVSDAFQAERERRTSLPTGEEYPWFKTLPIQGRGAGWKQPVYGEKRYARLAHGVDKSQWPDDRDTFPERKAARDALAREQRDTRNKLRADTGHQPVGMDSLKKILDRG